MQSHSLLLTAPQCLEWIFEDLPPLQPNEVLIQTTAGAISIGAELPQYLGTARTGYIRYPYMTGYESIGIVADCGSAVQRLKIGDRVVAFYGHRTYAIVPEAKAILVPNGVSDTLALLVILTCDASKGIRKIDPKPDEQVLITGAGTIGLLTLFILKAHGIQNVDMIEPLAKRRILPPQLGSRNVENPLAAAQRDMVYDVGIECSSRNAAFELMQQKMTQAGRICILADGNIEPLVLTPAFHEKELTVVGSSDGWDYQEHAKWYFDVVAEYGHILEQLFEYHTSSDKLIETFESLTTGMITPIKVLVQYSSLQSED